MGGSGQVKFVADAMLGSLARKLRAFGFDTTYYRSGDDAGIMRQASGEGRVILTADRELASKAVRRGARVVLLTGAKDSSRLSSLVTGAGLAGIRLAPGEPRCSVCNGALEPAPKSEVFGLASEKIIRRHRLFFRCTLCGHIYWRGGHWKKLRSLKRRLPDPG